jgi:hypothetical protein
MVEESADLYHERAWALWFPLRYISHKFWIVAMERETSPPTDVLPVRIILEKTLTCTVELYHFLLLIMSNMQWNASYGTVLFHIRLAPVHPVQRVDRFL